MPQPAACGCWMVGQSGVGGGWYKIQDILFDVVLHILYRNISTIELLSDCK